MGLLADLLVNLTETTARRLKNVSREKLAKLHEDIAKGIREGKFIPDDAIKEFQDDAQKIDDVFAGLPD